jgi:two-component system sensor histidine kinase VicK
MSPPRIDQLEVENGELRAQVQALQAVQATLVARQAQVEADKQRQLWFHTVFTHSPLGHQIIGPDLAIHQANTAVATLLGLESPQELIGHAILEFAHPDYYADWARLQVALWEHNTPTFALETCPLRANGTLLWCRVTSVLFPDGGGELGYITLEDIATRKQLEAQV